MKYIKDLAEKLGSDIVSEREELFTIHNIEQFNYTDDILYGIKCFFDNKDTEELITFGIVREVALNKKLAERFLNAENPIEAFGTFYKEIQYLDAFSANQMFFEDKNTKKIIGIYTLTQEAKTILPYKPSVEFKNLSIVKDEYISVWKLALMIINGAPENMELYQKAGEIEYSDFIARLPRDKYRFIDAKYIVIDALTQEEILSIAGKN